VEDDVRQGLERVDVADDPQGLLERADEVLAGGDVDRRFAADRRIDRCQQRRGDLDVIDAAQERGGREPGQVTGDTAAEGDEKVGPGQTPARAEVQDGAHDVERLGRLSRGECEDDGLKAFRFERLLYGLPVQGRDVAVTDDADFAGRFNVGSAQNLAISSASVGSSSS